LVEQLGGKPTPAVGFAMGVERLILMLEALDVIPEAVKTHLDVYLVAVGNVTADAMKLSAQLREENPDLRLQMHCGGGNFKKQMKKADKSGARFALLLGEDEAQSGKVALKSLKGEFEQLNLAQTDVGAELKKYL